MDYKDRIRFLKFFLVILMVVFGSGIFYKMILQREDLSRKVFIDKKRLEIIQNLAREGIIQPEDKGEGKGGNGVVIDEEKLAEKITSKLLRQFILARKEYMTFEDENSILDPTALSVSNHRLIRKNVELNRGRILDRNMQVLAESIKTENGLIKRLYPAGQELFPLIGVAHPVYGKKGLERYLDNYLRGTVDHGFFSSVFRMLTGKEKNCDVVLTIDRELQKTAFQSLGNRTGAVVVIDVQTGEILAAASFPSFDPGVKPGIEWDRAEKKGIKGPFVNRAFEQRYPPGSTYKLVVASALLEKKDFDIKWGIECKGRHPKYGIREHKNKHHGWMGLKNAIAMSCNVFFAEAGVRLGPELLSCSQKFGFNRGVDLLEQGVGKSLILPSRAFTGIKDIRNGGVWEPIDFKRNPKLVAQGSVGQNLVEATPFQMARVGAGIGNNGVLMKPCLIKSIKFSKKDGNKSSWYSVKSFSAKSELRVMSKENSRILLDMMKGVTDKGTGYRLEKIFFKDGEYQKSWKLPKDKE
ncbi:MAG: hypothetical protein K8S18_22255, partial [Desulfobacula sp.]|nr:hypothetical protein [Desulfobacula sp.]